MGRKKKKQVKPWCWYCDREFEDEKILLQHQRAKHFKCHICHKKLYTGPGLQIHCMQVHKENVDRVPNANPGRDNIEIEIYGMEGIPEKDAIAKQNEVDGLDRHVGPSPFAGLAMGGATVLPQGVLLPASSLAGGVMPMVRPQLRMPIGVAPNPLMNPLGAAPLANPARPLFPSALNVATSIAMSNAAAAQQVTRMAAASAIQQQQAISQMQQPQQEEPNDSSSHQSGGQMGGGSNGNAPAPERVPPPAAGSRIMHPEENLSLEELLYNLPQYKNKSNPAPSAFPGGVGIRPMAPGMPGAPMLGFGQGAGDPFGPRAALGGGAGAFIGGPSRPMQPPPGYRPPSFQQGPVRY